MTLIVLFFAAIGFAIYVGLQRSGALELLKDAENISDLMNSTFFTLLFCFFHPLDFQFSSQPCTNALTTYAESE